MSLMRQNWRSRQCWLQPHRSLLASAMLAAARSVSLPQPDGQASAGIQALKRTCRLHETSSYIRANDGSKALILLAVKAWLINQGQPLANCCSSAPAL